MRQQIDEINETPGITWKAAMNERFRDLPLGSSKSLIGECFVHVAHMDYL